MEKWLSLLKRYSAEFFVFAILYYFYLQFVRLPDPTYGDESILLNGAYRILQGETIYKDFAEYITPLPFYFLTGIFKIFGVNLLVARIFNSITMLISSILIYLILKSITKKRMISIFVTLTFSILGYSFWYITSHHWMLLSVELIVIYLLIIFLEDKKNIYIILAGFLTSLTPFIIQHKGGLFAFSVTVWVFIMYYYLRDRHFILSYLISLLIFPILFLFYLIGTGNLLPMIFNIININIMGYYISKFVALPHYFFTGKNAILLFLRNISMDDIVLSIHNIFRIIYYTILGYLPFVCLTLFSVKVFSEWRGQQIKDAQFYKKILFHLTGILTFSGIFIGRSDQYQLIVIFPFQIFILFFISEDIKRINPILNPLIILLTAGALVYGVENVVEIKKEYIYPVTAPTEDILYYKDNDLAEDIQNFYSYSQTNIRKDNIVALYWGDKFFFYLQKKNPLYFNLQIIIYSEVEELHDPMMKIVNETISKIEDMKIEHIIWDRYGTREWDYAAFPFIRPLKERFVKNPLIDYIQEHYNVVAFFPVANIVVYKRK